MNIQHHFFIIFLYLVMVRKPILSSLVGKYCSVTGSSMKVSNSRRISFFIHLITRLKTLFLNATGVICVFISSFLSPARAVISMNILLEHAWLRRFQIQSLPRAADFFDRTMVTAGLGAQTPEVISLLLFATYSILITPNAIAIYHSPDLSPSPNGKRITHSWDLCMLNSYPLCVSYMTVSRSAANHQN